MIPFDPEWIVNGRSENCKQDCKHHDVRNVDAYLARIESVQGEGGSRGLVRAAAVCRDAGLPEAVAMEKLICWNRGANPPWSMEELGRAVTRVYR